MLNSLKHCPAEPLRAAKSKVHILIMFIVVMKPVNVTREVMRGFSDSTWTQHNTWKRAWPRSFIVGRGEAAVWCVDVKKLHKHERGFTTGWFHNWKQGITPIASIHTYRFFLWSQTCSLRDYYRQREKKEKRQRNHSTSSACQREIIHQTRPRLLSVDNKRQAVRSRPELIGGSPVC